MSDLHIDVRYGLPEFAFDLPEGWELLPLGAENVKETVRTALGAGAPEPVVDAAAKATSRELHEQQTFAVVRFNDPERGFSRVWLTLSTLRAPEGKTIGQLAQQLVDRHGAVILDSGGRVLRWSVAGEALSEGMFGRTCYLVPSPVAPQERALYVTGWTVVTDGQRAADPEQIELLLAHQATMVLRHSWVDQPHISMTYEAIAAGNLAD